MSKGTDSEIFGEDDQLQTQKNESKKRRGLATKRFWRGYLKNEE